MKNREKINFISMTNTMIYIYIFLHNKQKPQHGVNSSISDYGLSSKGSGSSNHNSSSCRNNSNNSGGENGIPVRGEKKETNCKIASNVILIRSDDAEFLRQLVSAQRKEKKKKR